MREARDEAEQSERGQENNAKCVADNNIRQSQFFVETPTDNDFASSKLKLTSNDESGAKEEVKTKHKKVRFFLLVRH